MEWRNGGTRQGLRVTLISTSDAKSLLLPATETPGFERDKIIAVKPNLPRICFGRREGGWWARRYSLTLAKPHQARASNGSAVRVGKAKMRIGGLHVLPKVRPARPLSKSLGIRARSDIPNEALAWAVEVGGLINLIYPTQFSRQAVYPHLAPERPTCRLIER